MLEPGPALELLLLSGADSHLSGLCRWTDAPIVPPDTAGKLTKLSGVGRGVFQGAKTSVLGAFLLADVTRGWSRLLSPTEKDAHLRGSADKSADYQICVMLLLPYPWG